jgi:hypothetical protein
MEKHFMVNMALLHRIFVIHCCAPEQTADTDKTDD